MKRLIASLVTLGGLMVSACGSEREYLSTLSPEESVVNSILANPANDDRARMEKVLAIHKFTHYLAWQDGTVDYFVPGGQPPFITTKDNKLIGIRKADKSVQCSLSNAEGVSVGMALAVYAEAAKSDFPIGTLTREYKEGNVVKGSSTCTRTK